ncbi:MAG: hypothetical protein K2H64_01545 [Desulfovibrio sp.]|nr:hypothetical protein [Desulfovibrio sp.]
MTRLFAGPVFKHVFFTLLTVSLAFCLRLLEWPRWQNPEYRLGDEMLLATHDAYHWLAGAEGFGLGADHPMALFLKYSALLTGVSAPTIAFWAPPVFASLAAGATQIVASLLGGMSCGIAAGLIASIAPGFLGRTLLGYYDTDLVTLLFPLLIILVPIAWQRRCLLSPAEAVRSIKGHACPPSRAIPASGSWLAALSLSGLLAWQSATWHSVFPYLIRYDAAFILIASVALAPSKSRETCFLGALCFCFPALAGLAGLPVSLGIYLYIKYNKGRATIKIALLLILSAVFLWFFIKGEILRALLNQINAYLKHSGDSHSSGGVSLVFPSVAQSIIEVQDLSLAAIFPYFHPWFEAALLGVIGYAVVVVRRPAALYLLPLAALAFLSSRLGGRMVMFGAPVIALGLTLPCVWIFRLLPGRGRRWAGALSLGLCLILFVAPFLDMIPALSQGPSINRRHAQALAAAGSITPENSMLWLWWDWGYAAHYFAKRRTIADGARHGGPSLYLPAAVFATDNPRFARQIIRFASSRDDEPGDFFAGLDPQKAQELIDRLRSSRTPLEPGKGRQFIIVSFEMLRLGFWISNFGNWNFVARKGEGGALSIVPQGLSYKLSSGEVKLEGAKNIIYPASITIFEETGLIKKNYIQEWVDARPGASEAEKREFIAARRNINFVLNRVTDEKLVMDESVYNAMMAKLLCADPLNPEIAPYFKLVYDNVFARVYEVLPNPDAIPH